MHFIAAFVVADGHSVVVWPGLQPVADFALELPDGGVFRVDVIEAEGHLVAEDHGLEVFHDYTHFVNEIEFITKIKFKKD